MKNLIRFGWFRFRFCTVGFNTLELLLYFIHRIIRQFYLFDRFDGLIDGILCIIEKFPR